MAKNLTSKYSIEAIDRSNRIGTISKIYEMSSTVTCLYAHFTCSIRTVLTDTKWNAQYEKTCESKIDRNSVIASRETNKKPFPCVCVLCAQCAPSPDDSQFALLRWITLLQFPFAAYSLLAKHQDHYRTTHAYRTRAATNLLEFKHFLMKERKLRKTRIEWVRECACLRCCCCSHMKYQRIFLQYSMK